MGCAEPGSVGAGVLGGLAAQTRRWRWGSHPGSWRSERWVPCQDTHPVSHCPTARAPRLAPAAAAKTFDLAVRMRSGQDFLFRSIPRDEWSNLFEFIQAKQLRIENFKEAQRGPGAAAMSSYADAADLDAGALGGGVWGCAGRTGSARRCLKAGHLACCPAAAPVGQGAAGAGCSRPGAWPMGFRRRGFWWGCRQPHCCGSCLTLPDPPTPPPLPVRCPCGSWWCLQPLAALLGQTATRRTRTLLQRTSPASRQRATMATALAQRS